MSRCKVYIRSILCLCIALFLLCGCAKAVMETPLVEPEVEEKLTVIGFSQPGAESDWRVAHTNSAIEAFSKDKGYKLLYKDGQSKQENQIRDIRTFIQQQVDYIILSPIVETGWDSVLEEAKAAGIPVIISDRFVDVEDDSLYTAYVGSNFAEEGTIAVNYLENYLTQRSLNEEPFNIIHIQGTIGSSAQKGRTEALEAACEENKNWNIIAQASGDFTKAKGYEVMKEILKEVDRNSINVVYCENDNMAYGVIDALYEKGISYGTKGRVMVVSFDATQSALEKCKEGKINIEVECNPIQGPLLLETIEALKAGKTVPTNKYVSESYFLPETLSENIINSRLY